MPNDTLADDIQWLDGLAQERSDIRGISIHIPDHGGIRKVTLAIEDRRTGMVDEQGCTGRTVADAIARVREVWERDADAE